MFWHRPRPEGNVFSIRDVVSVRTRSAQLDPWDRHAVAHGMIQDLMCLAYGKPCGTKMVSIKREDDQPYLQGEDDIRRTWRRVYQPGFGRGWEISSHSIGSRARPLFYLGDVSENRLETWMREWAHWSRPTWIAVTTMFQQQTTVEARLLQVGVALESLGYALWKETGPAPHAKTPSFPRLLERVTAVVGLEHTQLYGENSAAEWRAKFDRGFKGIKHSDNELTAPLVALKLAAQGLTLIRCWLATHLGVDPGVLAERLDHEA